MQNATGAAVKDAIQRKNSSYHSYMQCLMTGSNRSVHVQAQHRANLYWPKVGGGFSLTVPSQLFFLYLVLWKGSGCSSTCATHTSAQLNACHTHFCRELTMWACLAKNNVTGDSNLIGRSYSCACVTQVLHARTTRPVPPPQIGKAGMAPQNYGGDSIIKSD